MFNFWLIDRYVFSTFSKVLCVAFISLAGLYVVIDGMSNLDELLAYAKTQAGGIGKVLVDYYVPHILVLFDYFAGLLAMLAGMLTITLLQRHQETTALMAAGVSKMRVVRPLLLGAVGMSLLGVLNREFLLPKVRERLAYNAQDLSGQLGRTMHPRYDNKTRFMFSGTKAFAKEKRFLDPQVRLPAEFSEWGEKIEGTEAFYVSKTNDRPSGYYIKGVKEPTNLADVPSAQFENTPVLLSPSDHAWLKPNECFVVSELSFESLVGNTNVRHYHGTMELITGLKNPSLDYGNDVKVIIHSRFLQPVLDFVVFFLGIPLVFGRENRNLFVAAGMCGSVVIAFLVITLASHTAGAAYLIRPVLAAWLPLLIFGPLAYSLTKPIWD